MRAWIPFPDLIENWGPLPDTLDVEIWTGEGDLPSAPADVDFYVIPYLFGDPVLQLIERLDSVKVVQTLTAGTEHVRPYLRSGVTLCNARGVHDASTAELAVTLALASLRGIPEFVRAAPEGRWEYQLRPALADKTVLILGYGAIGEAIERRLAGFEVEVLRVARTAREGVSALAELPALLPRADVVILVVPLTGQTRGMVDAQFLSRMKDGALLVNVARGGVVDTAALLAELTAGRLTAAVDVTDPEPLPPHHPLWQAPGLIITPHVGGNSSAFEPRAQRLVHAQLTRYGKGEPLANVIEWDS